MKITAGDELLLKQASTVKDSPVAKGAAKPSRQAAPAGPAAKRPKGNE